MEVTAQNTASKENINTWISQIHTEFKLAMSVDCVIFGYTEADLYVALIPCNMPPYEGDLSLVGDLLHANEDLDQAVDRILWERIGLRNVYCEQVQVFSQLGRHPLGRVVTVAYYSLIKVEDYKKVAPADCPLVWKKVDEVGSLAFDHNEVFGLCLEKLRRQLREHPVGFSLLPKKFTLNQLQQLYEVILNMSFDKRNFRRKLKAMDAITDVGEVERDVRHRPAKLYSFDLERFEASGKNSFAFVVVPTCLSTTSPSLMIRIVGIERIPYCIEICGFSSTLTLPIFTLPSYSFARSSTIGPMSLHGPHHSAQKSITETPPARAVSLKFASVNSNAMSYLFDILM